MNSPVHRPKFRCFSSRQWCQGWYAVFNTLDRKSIAKWYSTGLNRFNHNFPGKRTLKELKIEFSDIRQLNAKEIKKLGIPIE